MVTCPVCRRSLALADRNGRHVASEAHFPHRDPSGVMTCSPLTLTELGSLTVDVECERRPLGGAHSTLVTMTRKVAPG